MKLLSRRLLLRGAGAAVALPLLDAMEARADPQPIRRFISFFSANGTLFSRWAPTMGSAGLTLSPILSPLAAHTARLLPVTNLDFATAMAAGSLGDGHQKGIGHVWTGAPLEPGSLFGRVNWAGGPSVDQRIADAIGDTTRFRSLELGVQVKGARVYDRMVYRARGQPLPPELDPAALFDRLFGGAEDPVAAARRKAHRKSVLDAVLGEYRAVSQTVGAADRQKLEAHATTLREVEQRLDAAAQPTASCAKPSRPQPPDLGAGASYPELGRLQMDLLVLALSCDLTRVASLQWSSAASPTVFSWLGHHVDHHELSHRSDDDADAQLALEQIHTWYSGQLAMLLDRLAGIPEGTGTLLDHCVVAWGNELGKGNIHDFTSVPFVLAGSGGGALRTGRLIDAGHRPHNALLLGLLRAFGVDDATFGDPAACADGPLSLG